MPVYLKTFKNLLEPSGISIAISTPLSCALYGCMLPLPVSTEYAEQNSHGASGTLDGDHMADPLLRVLQHPVDP